MIPCQLPLREMLTLMCKKNGILGALAIAVGILGAPYFRNFGSPKIRKNGNAPFLMTENGLHVFFRPLLACHLPIYVFKN